MSLDVVSQPAVTGRPLLSVERGLTILVLTAFVAVVGWGIAVHEPWLDEAQAWLLARDASIVDLLTTYLRYEGHPPLWSLLLKIPVTLGLPYKSMNVMSGIAGLLGVVLLQRVPRVPLVLKLLIPFTYFIAYQYGVISRSYALLFPTLVAILSIYPRRADRIWPFTALLLVLSHISAHGLLMAGALTFVYLVDVARRRQSIPTHRRGHQLAALAVLLLNVVFLAFVLWPPADLAIAERVEFGPGLARMYWISTLAVLANLFGDNPLSLVFLGVLIVWFHRRGVLIEFLLMTLGVAFIARMYYNAWHQGLFVNALFFAVLLAYAWPRRCPDGAGDRRLTAAVTIAFSATLALQIVWTARALHYDTLQPYSGSRAAAEYIRHFRLHERQLFGAGFAVIAVQPYFDRNIFANYAPAGGYAFLDWTNRSSLYLIKSDVVRAWMKDQLAQAPEFFLVSQKLSAEGGFRAALERDPRYRLLARFPGAVFWKTETWEREAFLLYGRTDAIESLRSAGGAG